MNVKGKKKSILEKLWCDYEHRIDPNDESILDSVSSNATCTVFSLLFQPTAIDSTFIHVYL